MRMRRTRGFGFIASRAAYGSKRRFGIFSLPDLASLRAASANRKTPFESVAQRRIAPIIVRHIMRAPEVAE